jgi:hypothetical protein
MDLCGIAFFRPSLLLPAGGFLVGHEHRLEAEHRGDPQQRVHRELLRANGAEVLVAV